MKLKENLDGSITWKGVTYPGHQAYFDKVNFDPERWFEYWWNKAQEIKTKKLTPQQADRIKERLTQEALTYGLTKQTIKKHQRYHEISDELDLALEYAISNYTQWKKENSVLNIFINKLALGLFSKN